MSLLNITTATWFLSVVAFFFEPTLPPVPAQAPLKPNQGLSRPGCGAGVTHVVPQKPKSLKPKLSNPTLHETTFEFTFRIRIQHK